MSEEERPTACRSDCLRCVLRSFSIPSKEFLSFFCCFVIIMNVVAPSFFFFTINRVGEGEEKISQKMQEKKWFIFNL